MSQGAQDARTSLYPDWALRHDVDSSLTEIETNNAGRSAEGWIAGVRPSNGRSVLGVLVSSLELDESVTFILERAYAREAANVAALAVHGVMTGALSDEQRYRLNTFDLVTADGQPVRWALNLIHRSALQGRVAGPELMGELCTRAAAERFPIYLYGGSSTLLDRLSERLRADIPGIQIAGAEPSLFRSLTPEEEKALVQRVNESGARMLFVGLGCPRQEIFLYEHRGSFEMPALAVGAAFAAHAGIIKRPTRAWQRAGLEWLFRLVDEPRRLWRRYVL